MAKGDGTDLDIKQDSDTKDEKVHGNDHAKHAPPKKVVDKKPPPEDTSKPGQCITHMTKAVAELEEVGKVAAQIIAKAQAKKDPAEGDQLKAMFALLVPHRDVIANELDQAWYQLYQFVGDEWHAKMKPGEPVDQNKVDEAKATALGYPRMKETHEKLVAKLASYLSDLDSLAIIDKSINWRTAGGGMVAKYQMIAANLGLPAASWDELAKRNTVRLEVAMVDLGTGRPRDKIQEAVASMTDSWNKSFMAFTASIGQLIDAVTGEEFQKAPAGLMAKIWEGAQDVLKKGAKFVAGSELPATLSIGLIEKVLANEEEAEKERKHKTKAEFVEYLNNKVNEVFKGGVADDAFVSDTVSQLDQQFVKLGKAHPEDAWKEGDKAVFDTQAAFLKDLRSRAIGFHANIPTPHDFVARYLTDYININHKMIPNSAWRSPLEGPEKQDGYIGVDLELHYDGVNWFLTGNTGTLHCTNSQRVADNLRQAMGRIDLSQIWTNIILHIKPRDGVVARSMPESYRDDTQIFINESHLLARTSSAQAGYWSWLTHATRLDTQGILSQITTLEG